jgi:hypothetical protein
MKIRVILPDENVRTFETEAAAIEELEADFTRNVGGVPGNFILNYFDRFW